MQTPSSNPNEFFGLPGVAPGARVTVEPEATDAREALARARRRRDAGDAAGAEAMYLQALRHDGNCFPAACELAELLHIAHRLREARRWADEAVGLRPDHPAARRMRARILRDLGEAQEAADDLRAALAVRPDDPDGWENLGELCLHLEAMDEAELAFRRASALDPDRPDPLLARAGLLRRAGRNEEAIAVLRRLLHLHPRSAAAWTNLGTLLTEQEEYAEAHQCFDRAAALRPDLATVPLNRGNLLAREGRDEEALAAYDRAMAMDPSLASARLNRSVMLLRAGRDGEGWEEYRQGMLTRGRAAADSTLQTDPASAEAHFNRALLLLRQGRLREGFREYLWRWSWPGFNSYHLRQRFPCDPWQGRALGGKHILIHAEQGLGDVIQFVRYLPMVAERGGRIVLEVTRELVRLLERMDCVERVVPRGAKIEGVHEYCPLLNLPAVFETTRETIPADVPYLSADPADVERWRKRFAGTRRLKVGLVWAGSPGHKGDKRRSMDPTHLRPLLKVPHAAFYSLQVARGHEVRQIGAKVVDLADELRDLADTAAVLEQMDLLISVDTAAAHLAAALARPVWLLLFFESEWRWGDHGDATPWYPTMRIFRQRRPDDWPDLIARVADALRQRAAART